MKSVALIIITHLLVIAIRTAVVLNAPQSAPPPCVPAAANWKTLVACRTQTAQALTGTPTATATVLPVTATSTATTPGASRTPVATPTKVTGTEAPGCWVIGNGVRFKFSPCEFSVEAVP